MNSRMITYLLALLCLLILAKSLNAQYKCLTFDGYNDIVHVDNQKILNLSTSGTIEAWINVDTFKIAGGIVHKGDKTDYSDEEYSLQLYWQSGQYNKICFVLGHSNGTEGTHWNKLVSNTTLVSGEWYHVAAVWNSNNMYLYINGNLDNSRTNTVMPVAYDGGLNIGSQCYTEPPRRPFDGKIDEVRLWNYDRSRTEIRESMYKQMKENEPGLIASYSFEEGSGNKLYNNALAGIEKIDVTSGGSSYTSVPSVIISGGGGSGASAYANMTAKSIMITNGGSRYRVNDILTVSGGVSKSPLLIKVNSVSLKIGAILTATIYNAGDYTSLPSNPVSVTGGSGTGAKFSVYWGVSYITITNAGSNYSSTPSVSFNPTGASATVSAMSDLTGAIVNGPVWTTENAPVAHKWLGSISSNWVDSRNWFANWLPYKNIPVRIPVDAKNNCMISDFGYSTEFLVECERLLLEDTLTISAGYVLKAYGNTSLSGLLVLESDTSCRTGNFIDNGTINYLQSKDNCVVVKKYLTPDKWHYNSIPVEPVSSNVFWGSALYYYYEPDGIKGTLAAWKKIGNDYSLEPLTGYDAYVKAKSKTIVFRGGINTGTFSKTNLTRQYDGYNFVGNPYPSVIDWDASSGWTRTNLDNAIYIWDPNLNGGQGNFMSYVNGVGTNGGSRFIPATQGFWVRVSSGYSTGSITMTNDVRVIDNTKYRTSASSSNTLRIICKGGNFNDETVIRFSDEATENFDNRFDADKFFASSGEGSMIYTKCPEGPLSVNSFPFKANSFSVTLYSKVLSENLHTLQINLENFDYQIDVFLEDKLTGTIHDFRKGIYQYYARLDDPEDRFVLHFGNVEQISIQNNTTGIVKEEKSQSDIKVYAIEDKNILISAGDPEQQYQVIVYDVNGKLIDRFRINSGNAKFHLNTNSKIVIVHVLNNSQTDIFKIILH